MFNDRNLWRACFWWTDEVLRGHLVPEICHCTRGQHSLRISVNNLMQGVVISHSTGGGVWINDWASILSHANFTHSCRYLPWTCVCLRWDKKMTNTVQQKPSSQMAQMQHYICKQADLCAPTNKRFGTTLPCYLSQQIIFPLIDMCGKS